MKSTIFLFVLFITLVYSLPGRAARPSPEKSAQEIFNDIYVDTVGSEAIRTTTTFDTTGLATNTNQVTTNAYLAAIQSNMEPQMASGVLVNFASTNILDSAYSNIFTAPSSVKWAAITQNGGGDFFLRVGTTDYGYIYPGQSNYVPMNLATSDVVSIKSVSGSVTSGKLYINFYK
jgi:hypothetical protein